MAGYGDDAGLSGWLTARGLALPADAAPAVLREIGSAYVDRAYAARLYCSRPTEGAAQERAWPRTGAQLGGAEIAPDEIPLAWIHASYRAAWLEFQTPGRFSRTHDLTRIVKRQKVDSVEREFFEPPALKAGAGGASATVDEEIDGLVAPYLCDARSDRWAWA